MATRIVHAYRLSRSPYFGRVMPNALNRGPIRVI